MIEDLTEILGRFKFEFCSLSKGRNSFQIRYGQEYNAPELNLRKLIELSKLFGTTEIDVDDYSQSGCDTCDYGSDYGHEIQVYNPTLHVNEIKELTSKKK